MSPREADSNRSDTCASRLMSARTTRGLTGPTNSTSVGRDRPNRTTSPGPPALQVGDAAPKVTVCPSAETDCSGVTRRAMAIESADTRSSVPTTRHTLRTRWRNLRAPLRPLGSLVLVAMTGRGRRRGWRDHLILTLRAAVASAVRVRGLRSWLTRRRTGRASLARRRPRGRLATGPARRPSPRSRGPRHPEGHHAAGRSRRGRCSTRRDGP